MAGLVAPLESQVTAGVYPATGTIPPSPRSYPAWSQRAMRAGLGLVSERVRTILI